MGAATLAPWSGDDLEQWLCGALEYWAHLITNRDLRPLERLPEGFDGCLILFLGSLKGLFCLIPLIWRELRLLHLVLLFTDGLETLIKYLQKLFCLEGW